MSSTMPWWGSGLFTLGGALFGAVATLSLGVLNRRTERRRLSRDEKVVTYPEFVGAATRLMELPVWPADGDPRALCREVETLAQRVAFFGPPRVNTTLGHVVVASRNTADTILRIRAESRPGHQDQVDQRLAPRHRAVTGELAEAVAAFAIAGRADLEIDGRYTALLTLRDQNDTIGEPGAGSREPGAGSREPGAGSREPGAG